MLRAAVHDPDPVVVIESRALYPIEGPVYLDTPIESVGGARLRRPGSDALIVSWGRMVNEADAAAEELAASGIDAAVLDLRWLSPLDDRALLELAKEVRRVLVVHEANLTGGFGAEVAARVAETRLRRAGAPVLRLATPDVRMPAAPVLQERAPSLPHARSGTPCGSSSAPDLSLRRAGRKPPLPGTSGQNTTLRRASLPPPRRGCCAPRTASPCPSLYGCGSSSSAQELMQKRWPVGPGPSGKTCPRWPPQAAQVTSVRTIP